MSLNHLDPTGGVRMVDVGKKPATEREAIARGKICMKTETLKLISDKSAPKGDVLGIAQVSGIMAAKNTWNLVPLCHQLELTGINVSLYITPEDPDGPSVSVEARISASAKTGAEMEALTAVSIACLTVYDMCKAVDKEMIIQDIRVIRKDGGKSGLYVREGE